jgi:hypothetical protein
MIPVNIKDNIQSMDDETLCHHLNFLSYQFCVNADFSKEDAVRDLVKKLEMTVVEGLLRVFEDELGYTPLQNKIYEQTEKIFGDSDSYNINRMMSSLRRSKLVPFDPNNEKYIHWVRNRVRYGTKSIIQFLTEDSTVTA